MVQCHYITNMFPDTKFIMAQPEIPLFIINVPRSKLMFWRLPKYRNDKSIGVDFPGVVLAHH